MLPNTGLKYLQIFLAPLQTEQPPPSWGSQLNHLASVSQLALMPVTVHIPSWGSEGSQDLSIWPLPTSQCVQLTLP